ncbi:MAG TPA: hypothetical protein VGD58_22135 [Herpetosiphonaceae bacterium]
MPDTSCMGERGEGSPNGCNPSLAGQGVGVTSGAGQVIPGGSIDRQIIQQVKGMAPRLEQLHTRLVVHEIEGQIGQFIMGKFQADGGGGDVW